MDDAALTAHVQRRSPEGVLLLLNAHPDSYERTQRFHGLDPAKALGAAGEWLAEEKARVTRSRADGFIAARHGTLLHVTGWHRNAKKIVEISVQLDGADTLVRAKVIPSGFYSQDVGTAAEETAKEIIDGWLAGLWAKLGPQPALSPDSLLRRAQAAAYKGRRAALRGAALTAAGVATGILLDSQQALLGSGAGEAASAVIAAPGLLALMGGLSALRTARRLRKQAGRPDALGNRGS